MSESTERPTTLSSMGNTAPDINEIPLEAAFRVLNPPESLQTLFDLARQEDLGSIGDVTSDALLLTNERTLASVVTRAAGVVCGWPATPHLIEAYSSSATLKIEAADGTRVERGVPAGLLEGPLTELLALERPLLNLMSHLSGIATMTQLYVRAVHGTAARIYDTRKTTPGWRGLEKYAVRCGGGYCHRLGLHDAVLVKDNHLAAVNPAELTRWLSERLAQARHDYTLRFVEVEVDSQAQLRAVLRCPPGIIDIILLDNMSPAEMAQAVPLRDELNPEIQLEASGGVTLETVAQIASTGIDRIAVGSLTHSAPQLDLGLDFPP